ncbi:MAG: hypothetical protein EBX50_18285 [Chitinophagia bacterium]|nr:hypothetical protein [Chitinophagia bacterium]
MLFKSDLNANALLTQEKRLMLPTFDIFESLQIGEIAKSIGLARSLPIAVEVRHLDWLIYHASLPGSTKENQHLIDRKAQVVLLKQHSTLYEKISAEERGVDLHKENKDLDETHAIHGGGLPLITKDKGFVGALLISGLPQLEDHKFGVEVITEYLARKGELL